MSAFEADRFNHSRTSPKNRFLVASGQKKLLGHLPDQRTANRERLTTPSEKLLHQLCSTSGQHSAPYVHLMIQTGVIRHLQSRMDGACLRVVGAEYQAAEAGMNGRARAHGARLNCSKQFAVAEPVIPEGASCLAQRHDFRMGGGIAVGEVAIPPSSQHAPGVHHDRTHRHFAGFERALGAAQRFFHPKLVGGKIVRESLVGGEQLFVTQWRVARKLVLSSRSQLSVASSQVRTWACGLTNPHSNG
jgi:hypothetical protein